MSCRRTARRRPTYQHSPVVSEYFRHCEEERRRTRGDEARLIGAPGEIFPNIALLPRQPRTIAVWHPRGPHQTEVWRWFLVDREAPPEVKDFLRDYYIRYSGPAGMTEQDDMENWNYAHAASRGTIARRHPYCYEKGLGRAVENFEWDGLRMPGQGHRHHPGPVERGADAQPLPPLGPVHGSRQLGRARDLAPAEAVRVHEGGAPVPEARHCSVFAADALARPHSQGCVAADRRPACGTEPR